MGDEEDYWQASSAKGFSWDDHEDTVGLPSTSISAMSGSASATDDLVSFEAAEPAGGGRWAERVAEASRQIAAAAALPEPTSIAQVVGVRDVRRVEGELAVVREKLAQLQARRFEPLPPAQTVRDMVVGRPHSLHGYTSLQDKEALLDAALEFGDGDAILSVTMMLRNTLKRSKFHSIMAARQEAADVLVAHLVTRLELGPAVEVLQALDRQHEAGVAAYRQHSAAAGLEVRVRQLKQLLGGWRGHLDSDVVLEQINLCERLAPVISAEVAEPGRAAGGLANASVLRTLHYLATHHYSAGENLLHSPLALAKMHRLTDRQFTSVSLRARAAARAWPDCEALVVGKGWLGGRKAKGGVRPAEVVALLAAAGAPVETLTVVLQLVEGEERLVLGRKVGAAGVVVDGLLASKDRLALLAYQATMAHTSRDWLYADNALKNSNVKWKN